MRRDSRNSKRSAVDSGPESVKNSSPFTIACSRLGRQLLRKLASNVAKLVTFCCVRKSGMRSKQALTFSPAIFANESSSTILPTNLLRLNRIRKKPSEQRLPLKQRLLQNR